MKINEFNFSIGKPAALFDTTNPALVLTLNLFYGEQNRFSSERYECQKRRKFKKIQNETVYDAVYHIETRHKTLKRLKIRIFL